MCRCVGFFQIGLTWKFILFAMLLQTSKCGENLVLEIWIKMLHSIMSPWTMRENLMKPPEFFMVMSIFLKWMAGSNGRGRWQGGVIDSSLTFSFFQNFLLSTIAKKSTNIEKEFFIPGSISIYMPAFILIYLLFLFCLFFILEITLFFIFETWKISTVQIESIFHGEILKNLNIIYEDIFIWN